LARAAQRTEAQAEAAEAQHRAERAAEQAWREEQHGPGRPPAFGKRIATALAEAVRAACGRDRAKARRQEARELIRAIATAYHPYALEQGDAQSPERLAERLDGIWRRLEGLVEEADLPARASAHLAKAKRLTTALLTTVAFFFTTVQQRVEALGLPAALEQAVLDQLIPALYIERVAERSSCAEERTRLKALSARLIEPLRQPEHSIQALDADARAEIEQVAVGCADLFQRSSSAVEGRNGQRSLHHHGRHRLGNLWLAALAAVHNFHIRRPDGTTAAERLFGRAPPPPRRRRPRMPRAPCLAPMTTLAA
jgi:hypothetical protein